MNLFNSSITEDNTMLTGLTRVLPTAALGLAFSACTTVGHDFKAPSVPAGPGYRHQAAASVADARLPRQWWSVFGDATLDRLEQSALRDNPGVHAAAQRLLQAEAQLGGARASQAPSVSLNASAANARTSANTSQGMTFGHRAISGNNYTLGASMSYEFDLLGRVRRLVEAADAQALVAASERDGVLLMLSAQVASNYWQLRGLDAEMTILENALDSRRETEQLVEARFNAGLTNELDLSRARVERANAQADLHEVRRQRTLLEHGLAALTGASASSMLIAPFAGVLPAVPKIPAGLPASLLASRPDLAGSEAALRAANAQVGVAEGAFYPALQLTGNFGFASQNLRELTQGSSRQFSFGPLALSLPILDGGRNRANLALAQARYAEAIANHQGKLLTALREVEDALSDLEQRAQQGLAQAEASAAAARAHMVARARYERGISNYLDVTDAQRSSLAAERAATQIHTQRMLATVAVARALGAGWQGQRQAQQ
jgi:multidrug efflux system outer membrane protein